MPVLKLDSQGLVAWISFKFIFIDRSCKSKNGWRQYNTYLDSGVGHSDDTEVGVFFDVPGFIKKHSLLTIEFEVNCKSQCRLILEKVGFIYSL